MRNGGRSLFPREEALHLDIFFGIKVGITSFHLKGEVYVSSFNPKGVFVQGNKFQMRFPAKKGVALCLLLREELKMLKLIVDVVLLLPRKVIAKQVSRNDVELSIPWTLETAKKMLSYCFSLFAFCGSVHK